MSNQKTGPHQGQQLYTAGQPLNEATAAMILVHGRGATAPSIMELAKALYQPGFIYLAPQAANNSWYPNSFLAPIDSNQPGLDSGLQVIEDVIAQVEAADIAAEKIVIAGFSQGACLASEFVARNARRYGGLLAFSGGLIGPPGTPRDYEGSLDGMPIFLGCSDTDFHIPRERVHESTATFKGLGATVTERIYPNMGHTIIQDEIDLANEIVESIVTG